MEMGRNRVELSEKQVDSPMIGNVLNVIYCWDDH